MNTREEAYTASPDFSTQGILESYNSLIDLLKVRYSYTELRKLDWEQIRKVSRALPRCSGHRDRPAGQRRRQCRTDVDNGLLLLLRGRPGRHHWIDNWYFDESTGGLVKAFPLNVPLYAPKSGLHYDGAIVVLVDRNSASAAEYFPQFLQYHKRALVVGEHSSEGAGGAVEQVSLPGNMKFYFTKGRTYFAGTDDLNLEAKGVALDVRLPITEDNERAKQDGRDPVLETALKVLGEEGMKIASGRLSGTTWRLQRIFAAPGAPVQTEVPKDYSIAFADDGSLKVKTDCDASKASYEVGAGSALKITPTISTLAAGPESSLGDKFVTWLAASKTFQIASDGLGILTDAKSGVIALLFAPLP